MFTPYNPEDLSFQTGDEGNFKSKDKEKPHPLGQGYTGFTHSGKISTTLGEELTKHRTMAVLLIIAITSDREIYMVR